MEKDRYAGTYKMVIIDNEIDKKAINDVFLCLGKQGETLSNLYLIVHWQARYLFFLSQSFEIMMGYGTFLMLSIPSIGSL